MIFKNVYEDVVQIIWGIVTAKTTAHIFPNSMFNYFIHIRTLVGTYISSSWFLLASRWWRNWIQNGVVPHLRCVTATDGAACN